MIAAFICEPFSWMAASSRRRGASLRSFWLSWQMRRRLIRGARTTEPRWRSTRLSFVIFCRSGLARSCIGVRFGCRYWLLLFQLWLHWGLSGRRFTIPHHIIQHRYQSQRHHSYHPVNEFSPSKFVIGQEPNKSPEPTRVGAVSCPRRFLVGGCHRSRVAQLSTLGIAAARIASSHEY